MVFNYKQHLQRNITRQRIVMAILALLLFPSLSLQAQSVRSYESSLTLQELEEAIEKFLEKVDKGRYARKEDTQGFAKLYANRWFSPFNYNIYIGKVFASKKQTIVRVEGTQGDVDTLSQVLEHEKVIKEGSTVPPNIEFYEIEDKSYILSQGINLLSPSLGIIYQSYTSPRLRTSQAVTRALLYLFSDLVGYWVGGTRFFTTRHRPGTHQQYILLWWGINRSIGATQAFNMVRGHNHLAEFKYTFPVNW